MNQYSRIATYSLMESEDPDHPYWLLYCTPHVYEFTPAQWEVDEAQSLTWDSLWPILKGIQASAADLFPGLDAP